MKKVEADIFDVVIVKNGNGHHSMGIVTDVYEPLEEKLSSQKYKQRQEIIDYWKENYNIDVDASRVYEIVFIGTDHPYTFPRDRVTRVFNDGKKSRNAFLDMSWGLDPSENVVHRFQRKVVRQIERIKIRRAMKRGEYI